MSLQMVCPDDAWRLTVHWSDPIPVEKARDGCEQDPRAWFYFIIRRHLDGREHPHYIGKVTGTCVSKRLGDPDHRQHHEHDTQHYRDAEFLVALGEIEMIAGKRTLRVVDHVESLLIRSVHHADPEFPMRNKSKVARHSIVRSYVIKNEGPGAKLLPKEITLGIFIRH